MIGITSYLLIGYWFDRALACNAAGQAIIVNRVGDTFFTLILVAIIGLTLASGSLDLHDLNFAFNSLQSDIINYIGILLVLAAAGKSAQFMLHTWLPNAMEGESTTFLFILTCTAIFYLFLNNLLSYSDAVLVCSVPLINTQINKKDLSIITGNMLGDGHIGFSNRSKTTGLHTGNARFSITLDTYSYDYLLHLCKEVYAKYSKNFSEKSLKPWPNTNLYKDKDKIVTQFWFASSALPIFTDLHKLWYIYNNETNKYKKIVPINIHDMFDEISLAYWIMCHQ